MKHQHHSRGTTAATTAAAAVSVLAAVGLLSGCGSGTPSGGNVTVTVTPTVTAKPATPTSATPKSPQADDVGRRFDFGTVTKVSTVKGKSVLELDRWTWKGLDDAKLATSGVPVKPFTGPVPYTNQNAKLTYTIPVADGARILYHHCIAADQPLQTKSLDAGSLKNMAQRENRLLVRLDSKGAATSIQNMPGCAGGRACRR
jgi:hypothetical protein